MSDIDNVALGMGLLAASLPGTTTATAAETAAQNEVLKKTVIRTVGADSASATTGTFPIFRAPYACYVLGATLMADATIASNSSLYVTYTLSQDDGAGGSATVVSDSTGVTTATAAITAQRNYTFTLSSASGSPTYLASGAYLYLVEAKAGAGTKVTGNVQCQVTWRAQ